MKGASIILFSIYLISYVIIGSNGNYLKHAKKLIKLPVFFKLLRQDCFLKTSKFKSNIALKLPEMSAFCICICFPGNHFKN